MKTKFIELFETDSTNRFLHEYKQEAKEEMTIVTALHQTAGRGQGDNKWEDNAGDNLLFSVLLRLYDVPVERGFALSEAWALALKDALEAYTDGINIKWPNDIYWKDKKISGTLIETFTGSGKLKNIILGTGINVNQRDFNIKAPNPVSLYQIIKRETPLKALLNKVMEAFYNYYRMIQNGNYSELSAIYHNALYRRNGYFSYRDNSGEFEASIVKVEENGILVLKDKEGTVRSYEFKEVKFII